MYLHRPLRPEDEGLVNISRLPPAQKRAAWEAIQRDRPALAELLQEENFQALREAFDADVCVDADAVPNIQSDKE